MTRRRSPVLTVVCWALLAYFLLPLVWLLVNATKTNADLFSTFGLRFGTEFALFDNLRALATYQDGIFFRWFANTVLYAVVGAGGAALVAAMGGYALAKYDFTGRRGVLAAVLGAAAVPGTALAVPTYLLFSQWGLVNTEAAVILPALASPFGLFLMMIYAQDAVPDSLVEAARIDGAREGRIFWSIGFRLLVPGFVTVLLFQLVATWNNYFLPLIVLNESDKFPLTVGLSLWNELANAGGVNLTEPLYPLVITGSLIAVVPLVVAFVVLQRYWQSGIAAGGVKQ
ncbi:carbohydrate ABC transporter permease [Jiangella alkaliphila]|uniref:Multiple sugar transport system permease protein n=1 Tax=Jiangella alkaliphila TaxID=419479 RepID=A0A1H2GW37_9ACTN|nr:carbohydrate ABC transporter permease [Jiangella alkaliphila]SDU23751.1 multiple sugar transport system permease protein [Jiangella alkaliphila]